MSLSDHTPDYTDPVTRDSLRRMVETMLPIAQKRAALVQEMKTALEHEDERRALILARRLCGLSDSTSAAQL